ncbi:MAG: DUF1996 domain-containing protein [Actinobacteria bacterium]|nr:DUF1996 domain-containing protein [Actinomycetota bacterium]
MRRSIFAVLLVSVLLVGMPPAQATTMTMHCGFSHALAADPIVSPGVFPSAHEHTFYGNNSTDQDSTADSLLADPSSTCKTSGDSAAYWAPTLYVDGVRLALSKMHVGEYWLNNGLASVEAPPFGAALIGGSPHASSPDEMAHVDWHCRTGPHYSKPVDCTGLDQGPLKYEVFFQNCWDGTGTAQTDFAYGSGKTCPSGFDHPVAQLALQVDLLDPSGHQLYDPFDANGNVRITFGDGSMPWYEAHADFLNGWNEDALKALIDGCLNKTTACPTHA